MTTKTSPSNVRRRGRTVIISTGMVGKIVIAIPLVTAISHIIGPMKFSHCVQMPSIPGVSAGTTPMVQISIQDEGISKW